MTKRIAYLDYARVIVALLVIWGHLLEYECEGRLFLYAFHMPFFFLVSGMLHHYRGYIDWRKYTKQLLFPMAIFIVLYIILTSGLFRIGFWDYTNVYHHSMPDSLIGIFLDQIFVTVKGLLRGRQIADGPCWFLLALFWCKIANDLIEELKGFTKRTICLLGWAMMLYIMHKYNVLYWGQAVMAFPFYYLGYKGKDYIDHLLRMKYPMLLIFIGFGVSFLLTLVNGRVSMYGVSYGMHGIFSVPLFYLNGLAGSMGVLYFSSLFKERKWITEMAGSLLTILTV